MLGHAMALLWHLTAGGTRWIAVTSVLLMAIAYGTKPAIAGDTSGGGDCWRSGTPLTCRVGWGGANSYFTVSLIDQMNNSTLHSTADTARANWTVATGPQSFRWDSTPIEPTWVYLKVDNNQCSGCGYTVPFDSNGNNIANQSGVIQWANVFVPSTQTNGVTVFAHELGHTLRLGHHTNESTALMYPNSGTGILAPTPFDIGPNPPCSGITSSYWGVRCIYNFSN